MKSDPDINSEEEEKYKKATELLQKLWWFFFYLVISPLTIGFVSLLIFQLFSLRVYIVLSLSVITFMFAFLFFLKAYDKFRDKSFFLNKENNLIARIHITFLISILSFIVTPIFTLISWITQEDVSFELLPLISFATLYNIVYFYYRFKPIAFFSIAEGEFKHGIDVKITIKQPYNFIIVINYITHLIFLSITFITNLSWVFALMTNLTIYLITIANTRKICNSIKESIKENRSILQLLTEFKQKFVILITSLVFVLLIQMPLIVIIIFSFSGLELINTSFLSIIFLFLYLKSLFYINFYYSNRINVYRDSIKSNNSNDKVPAQSIKYQKYNTFLSGILIVLIAAFAFLINTPLLIVIVLPFFFIFSYSEQKAGICPKNYNKYIFLLNSIIILISISFGLFSEILLNYQFLIFLFSLYFILQIFVKTDYFAKENIIIIQNILAIACFTIIAYSIAYSIEFARFTSDPTIILIFNFMIHGLLISLVSLVSFYILYSRYFYQKRSRLFRSCLFINFFLIELFIFLLINLRTFFLMEILILSSLLFPSIFLFFIFVNYILGVFSRKDFLKISYYLLWALIGDIFLSILLINLSNPVILTLDFLFLSIFSQFNLKYGLKIEKVKESVVKKFTKTNSYFMTIELIALFFFFFYSIALAELADLALHDKIILSTYFSFLIMTILANILSRSEVVFSSSITLKINIIALFFSTGLAFYYTYIFTLGTSYVFLYPFISLFLTLYFPFYFLLRKRIYETFIRKGLLINSALLAIFITLIPIFLNLEFSRIGLSVDILSVINYTLLIFPLTLLFIGFTDYLLKLLSRKQFLILTFYLLWVLITDLFVIIFLVSLTEFVFLTLDLLFLSIFSQLNLQFGVKLEKIKDSTVKRYVYINSYIITGELFALSFFFFYTIVLINIVFSIYFSLLIITTLVNLLSWNRIIFSESLTFKINIITLTFSAGLAYYYSFLFTLGTFYVLLIPFLCLFSILFFPIYYMLRMRIYEKVTHRLFLVDCILIAIFLTLIPTIINLEAIRLGVFIEIIPTINYTLYIAFGILIFTYYLLRKYKINEKYTSGVLKSQIFIEIIIAGTTVFYYFFILLAGTVYSFLFPFIMASCFLYLPSIFSYRIRYFKENVVKKFILANSILLSVLITLIPTISGLELLRIGLDIDIFIISAISLILLFVVLNFLDFIGIWYNVKEKWTNLFKLFKVFTWFSISIFVSYVIFSYVLTDISISIMLFIFFILNIYTFKLLINYSKDLRIINYLQEFLLYGLTFSFSFLIISLIGLSTVLTFMPSFLNSFNAVWYLGLFLLISLPLIQFFRSLVKIEYTKVNNGIEFISWSILKIIICIFISMIFSFSILALIISFSLTFTFFTPITLSYFKKLKIFSEKNQLIIKRFMLGVFVISLLILYIDLFYQLTANESFFNDYLFLHISFILANSLLYLYYFLLRYNTILQIDSTVQIFGFYLSSFILFLSLLYIYWILLIVPVLFAIILLLYRRSLNIIFRFISYFLLSYVIFIDLLSIFNSFEILGGFNLIIFGFLTSTYLLTLISVLLFSILLNYKRNNNLEKFALYGFLSLLSFTFLNSYTNILILYNITISLFIFSLFMGIYFYRQNNELYKWFIKPCVLLLVFDFISFISYTTLFNNPLYINFSPILTFTLTMSITGFTFVILYNSAPANFRKKSFYFTLVAINICFPIFLYFCIVSPFPSLFGDPIPIIIVINVAVFLFYLSIGIYQWRISWAIWKSGWYAWNILPFVNFLIIYQSLRGIDVLGRSVSLFGGDFSGSSIISIIICSLFFLPVIYSKIKKYFLNIIFIVWAESLFLLYWISQNLFAGDILLTNLSFVLFSVILLMPLLIGLKFWKIASIFWLIPLTVINATFLFFYLISIGVSLEITISIDLLVIGLFLIVYSFFPNIRSIGIILIFSYFVVLIGIFLTIYFILYSVILDVFFSINISFIVMGFSLFSSKPLKFVSKTVDNFLSWILIINFSWLTFNTFSLLPRMEIFSFFLALTVFGCSFFIFNRYKMKFRINRVFPLLIVAIGTSSSITSLFSILFNLTPYILITTFSGIFLIFLYFLIIEYRYFLWALIPIPLTLPILELLLTFEVIRNIWLLAFSAFSTIYIIFFQILINMFKSIIKDESEEIKNSLMKIYQEKNQIKMLNFTCFLLNSVFFSLFISVIIPLLTTQLLFNDIIYIYHILDFLIIWPIFILFSLKYIEKSEIDLKIRDPLLYFNRICFVLYLLIPISVATNLLLFMVFNNLDFIIVLFSFLLTLSGGIFFESYIIDRRFFYYLFNSIRDKFTFWSWLAFINTLSVFLFIFHSNWFFLILSWSFLNQSSLYFLSHLDISKKAISNLRVVLFYILFISGSFYLGDMITNGILMLFEELEGISYFLLLFQNSFLLLFISSYIFIRIDTGLKSSIEVILLSVFQGFFAINWIIIFNLFNILNFFSLISIILIETCFCFKTIKYFNSLFFEVKKPKFLSRAFSFLIIILYFEISFLMFGLMIEFTGIFESILVSQLVFFALTLLDIYSLKKIKKNYAQFIHTISFLVITLMTFFILNQYVAQYPILLSLEVLVFILMQFYTSYSFFASFSQFYPNKTESIRKRRSQMTHVLGTCFYINLVLVLFQALTLFNVEPQLIFLSLSVSVYVLMIIDAYSVKFLGKVTSYLKTVSWIFIMVFTATYLISMFNIFNIVNYFTISLLILIETCFLFTLAKNLNVLFFEIKHPKFITKSVSSIIILLYFEISLLMYGLMIEFTGIFESILVSQLILFAFTLLDIYSIKRIKKGYAQFIHTISFFITTLMIVFILSQYVVQYPILLSFEILIFILMQFYTNYSFFASLSQLYPNRVESIKKRRSQMTQVLGTFFYISLVLPLFQVLISFNVPLTLIFLNLSITVHILMIIDVYILKFLGRISNYLRIMSWIFIITFTTTWLYTTYLITLLITSIPLIFFILILETAYLFKILDFWEYIVSHKRRLRFYLISISYFNFISWPIYFVTSDPVHLLNLFIFSSIILFVFTYIDKYIGTVKEKSLVTLRKASFLTIGLLLSIDIFILLGLVPNTTLLLNLSVAALNFIFFLGIIVKPFRKHSLTAFAFWAAIFSLSSLIISELSQFWQIIPALVILMILIYPFVFLLEELRELFNKFVDILVKFFREIKQLINQAFRIFFNFLKAHYKVIWILFSACLAVFLGILLSELYLSILLGPVHPTLLTIAIFAFLILVVPSSKSSDPDVIFKRRVLRLSYGWGSVIAFLFIYIDPVWYIATILISISVVGSIILVYLRRKEEREKIAVKWRFYTLLTLFILFISFIILLVIQQIYIHG